MKTLQKLREVKGWSRAELARRAGLNVTTVQLAETGRFNPYPGQLAKLALALEYPAGEARQLMEDDQDLAAKQSA